MVTMRFIVMNAIIMLMKMAIASRDRSLQHMIRILIVSCDSSTYENGYEDEDGIIQKVFLRRELLSRNDSDGDAEPVMQLCYPIECSSCDSSIYDESDSEGHVWCSECECYVDEDGDRLSGTYTCNTCNEDIEGLDSVGEIQCETCNHYIDSDGNCATDIAQHALPITTLATTMASLSRQLDEDGEISVRRAIITSILMIVQHLIAQPVTMMMMTMTMMTMMMTMMTTSVTSVESNLAQRSLLLVSRRRLLVLSLRVKSSVSKITVS